MALARRNWINDASTIERMLSGKSVSTLAVSRDPERIADESSRSPLEIVVDRIWRFFCSVRAAVADAGPQETAGEGW